MNRSLDRSDAAVRLKGRGAVARLSGGSPAAAGFALALLAALAWARPVIAEEVRRPRHEGLHASMSSSTAGKGNLHLSAYGRAFLWDNDAATRIPPTLPHAELVYGFTDYLDVAAGSRLVSYVLQPGSVYLRLKATMPDNKRIRLLGAAQTAEVSRNLMEFFPSNGYRVRNEGFGPEGFIHGNGDLLTAYRFETALDLELIRISSYLPFKLYANFGWEGALSSWIADSNAAVAARTGRRLGSSRFSKLPFALGLELKTFSTDFFTELEGDPFSLSLLSQAKAWLGLEGGPWSRMQVAQKAFDLHFLENPFYLHFGARLKYSGGLTLAGGFSWMLSRERGANLGPCHQFNNPCRDPGATDGFDPFYPQWKVFGRAQYPIRFSQPSSELYRSFLLKRYQARRKIVDIEKALEDTRKDAEEIDGMERRRQLEKRRKKAEEIDVELD